MLANDFVEGWENYLLFKKYFTGISNEPYLKKETDSIIYSGQILYSLFIYGALPLNLFLNPNQLATPVFGQTSMHHLFLELVFIKK